ncbi:unnamed protein product [Brachionus calyciflorus]|uniref:Uncharacterized protein n=1 Tax=Brachionus calyciflorus TaxID=104777 RepID=A0A813YLY9_9BILA|nr:unnamed protein product [Brachionus calyciflorus]
MLKLNCMNPNVSLELSKISNGYIKKSYKNKIKSKLFRFNTFKSKSCNLVSSTFNSQNLLSSKYPEDDFSDDSTDSESDLSFSSITNDDLNSSVSSVSSLEYEPFEIQTEKKKILSKKSIIRRPMYSSSRSSILPNKIGSFEPRITSSRKSLFQQNTYKPECSVCQETKQVESSKLTNGSGYFSFGEEQICSSTHLSIDINNQKHNSQNSETIFTNSSIFSNSNLSDFYV